MRIKQIHLERAVTINMGNYESARAEVGLVADVNEDDDYDTCMNELRELMNLELKAEVRKVLKAKD